MGDLNGRISRLEDRLRAGGERPGTDGARAGRIDKFVVDALDAMARIRRAPGEDERWRYGVEKLGGEEPLTVAAYVAALAHLGHPDEGRAREILEESIEAGGHGDAPLKAAEGLIASLAQTRRGGGDPPPGDNRSPPYKGSKTRPRACAVAFSRLARGPRRVEYGRVDEGDRRGLDRVTVQEAARRLGVSEGAVRKRVTRNTLRHDKAPDGRVFVYLDAGVDEGVDEGVDPHSNALISQLRDEVAYLRDENRRKDEIIMQQAITMRQLTAGTPQEPPRAPQTAAEDAEGREERPFTEEAQEGAGRRSWWRRWLGV